MSQSSKIAHFMNGVPELLILRTLAGQEMYGYQLVRAIQSSTGDAVRLSEGCVYPLLHSLQRQGWLSARRTVADGRPRVYYRITPKGAQRLEKMTVQWDGLAGAIRRALGGEGGEHEHPRPA
ncbi:MAG TPA: PadR family transcriptional regulator [Tepidisphaeraceae bacterium]|nr:PadR family transcriptional regulator [Tepidisphaeraceae bacterium]